MTKLLILALLTMSLSLSAGEVTFKNISLVIPDDWYLDHSVIYARKNKKVGELISKESWPYKSGDDFIAQFKKGFSDDGEFTKYIKGGVIQNIYWVCREGMWEGANGDVGIWYARHFWVNGPILTLYSHESCDENFEEVVSIAKTLKEK